MVTFLFFFSSCSTISRTSQIRIDYAQSIQELPGGIESFWPNNDLKSVFVDYWSIRYSPNWKDSFKREAPFFQEIVEREWYENIIGAAVKNTLVKLDVQSIQQMNEYFYEINMEQVITNQKKENIVLYITDRWVYAGNRWYHVIRDPNLFPAAS